ncbi:MULTISPECIES: hypothetical protein [Saccharothrix]|uniref:hypothetical protein n=1 Tax=Saccharothrix TaxID=2071 RepID=UPI00093C9158|nr:hypothetical protein [Saccharothrix sp. CB00851]OKI25222.1 hypothetical protein A6A25_33070 [Saccharothrix sp. CB00851]
MRDRFADHADPLEMHLVHRSAAGALLVIGVPLRVGIPSTVDKVLAHLAGHADLNTLLPTNRATARASGAAPERPHGPVELPHI